jgi:hypothetical protein
VKTTDFDIEPHLGASDAEPSLGEIIFRYYQPHLGTKQAVAQTDRYIAALVAAPSEPVRPVAYLHSHPKHFDEIDRSTLTTGDKEAGWSSTPLYKAPQTSEDAKKIVADLMERMDWMGTGSIASGDSDRVEFEQRITAAGLKP